MLGFGTFENTLFNGPGPPRPPYSSPFRPTNLEKSGSQEVSPFSSSSTFSRPQNKESIARSFPLIVRAPPSSFRSLSLSPSFPPSKRIFPLSRFSRSRKSCFNRRRREGSSEWDGRTDKRFQIECRCCDPVIPLFKRWSQGFDFYTSNFWCTGGTMNILTVE